MSGQGYRTRAGWTTAIAPAANEEAPPDAPSWVWAAVMAITAAAICVLVYLEAFRP